MHQLPHGDDVRQEGGGCPEAALRRGGRPPGGVRVPVPLRLGHLWGTSTPCVAQSQEWLEEYGIGDIRVLFEKWADMKLGPAFLGIVVFVHWDVSFFSTNSNPLCHASLQWINNNKQGQILRNLGCFPRA